MNDPNETMQSRVRQAQRRAEQGRIPGFDEIWAAAEKRASVSRRRAWAAGSAVTAVIVATIIVAMLRQAEQEWQFVNPAELESGISWAAPSDVLLPDHRVDIYREIPVLIESTKTEEGALL